MKKIYMILAAIALLSMSLNAQTKATENGFTVYSNNSVGKIATASDGSKKAPVRATYTLLNDDIDGSKYSTGSDIDNQLSAPWSVTYLRNQSGGVLYLRANGSMTFTVPSGYTNADFKFEFKTSTSYYNGYFTFTPSTGSAKQVTTSAASTVYECELTGLSAGNTVTITGKYGSQSYSPDFMYMYVYVASSTPTITASPGSVNLTCAPNESATGTVTVTGDNLTSGITATISGTDASLFNVSPASLGTSGGTLTVTYSPTAVGSHTATLTLSSTGAQDVTITLNGTCSNEKNLTVCDGQYVAQYFPYFGYYHDESEHIQMIYPASILGSSMAGGSITSMTFYPTSGSVTWSNGTTESASGINFYNGSITFKVANLTNAGAFDTNSPSFVNATLTPVSTINMPGSADANATTWVITFDQPFEYTGGDLLIDVTNPTTGQWGLTFFAGDDTGNNAYSYITSGGPSGALAFLPKVTFTYEAPTGPHHDLAIALNAPASIGATHTATVTATVTNNGGFDETSYTVTIYANGTAILTQNVSNETLVIGGSRTFSVDYPTTENDGGTTVNFSATVTCTDDAITANDQATASMSIVTLPPPENVVATPGDNQTATVTWDAPIIPSIQQNLTWDFESQSQFNDWTLVSTDNDNYNWTYNTYVEGSSASVFEPHSGTGYIVSPSFVNNVGALYPDNWLISPEVTLGGTFTFWAKGTDDTYYAENFGVFVYEGSYSSGITGFTQVDVDKTATAGWVKYTFDLSQYSGQGRIAIRHYDCTDQYWLEVDDIEYTAMVPGQQPTSYNVYLDGTLVGSVPSTTLSYDLSNLSNGNHTVEISAVYPLGESALVPYTFTTVPKTATPTITYVDNGDGTYTVTATGDGEVTLNVGGQTATGTGSASVVIVRSTEAQTMTATATAQETGKLESDPATQQITIPALTTDPTQMLEGLLRLHLVIVDQMKVDIPDDNSHPDRYGYVLRYEPNGANDTTGMKESSTVYVDIQKADCEVMGAYTLAQVDNDKHIGINHDQGIKMNVISADVEYNLSATNDLLYDYRLQGAENATPSYQSNYLSRLQKTQNFTYVEMEESNPNKGHEYPNGEYHYFVGEDNLKTGAYGSSYVSYAPSVSTWGIQRRYYEEDGYDNTYGAAIAKTGAGYVEMTADPKAELQTGKNGSTNWEYDGQACSLYILDNIKAEGKLPHSSVTTLSYEPYMFRVFVESKNGLLRHFQKVDGDGQTTGEHYEGIAGDPYGPICVWSGYVVDDDVYGQSFSERTEGTETIYMFQKDKVDRTNANGAWDQDESNAIFAAVDALAIEGYDSNGKPIEKDEIDSDDLNIFVRFYYIIEGTADDHDVQSGNDIVNGSRDGESSRPGNGAESPGKSPDPATGIYEIVFNGEVVSVTYVNALGMESDRPFDGINIVVVRYSDGKVSTTKVVR